MSEAHPKTQNQNKEVLNRGLNVLFRHLSSWFIFEFVRILDKEHQQPAGKGRL